MFPSRFTALLALALVAAACASGTTANNPYGVHTFIQDAMSDQLIDVHLNWSLALTGPGGYVKQLMYPVGPSVTVINPQWVKFINGCYSRGLIPVIRLGTWGENGSWVKPTPDSPGVYTTWANAIKNIVSQMPRNDNVPLYIEVLNECNNNMEWSGQANPTEYAQFFVQTSNAIRSLGDSRIRIMNCGLSPGGSYDNVLFVNACCNVPGFIDAFDVWACHPYPTYPPEINIHDGTAPMGSSTIDSYLAELQVLANHGRPNVQIIATETSYGLGESGEDARADLVMRAFRDYWSKWPEVLGICPYEFCDPFGHNDTLDWVDNSSGTTPEGLPTVAHEQYWSVYKLAKPGHTTGCISGKVTESVFGAPVSGAQVTLNPGPVSTTTDGAGVFMFPRLAPGPYSLSVSKANYTSDSASGIDLAAEENEVRNFSLIPTSGCNITGTIKDSLGNFPIQGVQVTLSPGGQVSTTGSDGVYRFLGVTPSTYTVSASKTSYYPYTSGEITLQAGDSRALDFYLGPGSRPAGTCLIGGTDFEGAAGTGAAPGWVPEAGYGTNFAVDATVRYSGITSQKILPGGEGNDMVWTITNYSAVTSGNRYRIEVWCKTSSGIVGAAKLVGNWFSNDMTPAGSFEAQPQPTTMDGWTLLMGRGICPPLPTSANKGRLQVELRAQTSAGTVWFDQAWCGADSLVEEPLPSVTRLLVTPRTLLNQFSWYNSSGAACTGTKVVYRTDRYPLSPADGTLVEDVSGAPGAPLGCAHRYLTFGQRYYYALFAHSATGGNLSRPLFATAVGSDLTAPTGVTVTDEGDYTWSPDSLYASWTASDAESGITGYRYQIGTSSGIGDVVGWTEAGASTAVTHSGLSLQNGKRYYFTVRATNGAGLFSLGYSNGIQAVRNCATVAQAWDLPDGMVVRLPGVVVAAGGAFPGAAYVQDADRTAGIRIEGSLPTLVDGQVIDVVGTLSTTAGERSLVGAVVQ